MIKTVTRNQFCRPKHSLFILIFMSANTSNQKEDDKINNGETENSEHSKRINDGELEDSEDDYFMKLKKKSYSGR